jgi:hypothetical protein
MMNAVSAVEPVFLLDTVAVPVKKMIVPVNAVVQKL